MDKLMKWYLIIGALLALGIPFLFMAIQVPSAMVASMLSKAAEYVILDEEDYDFWALVPGRTGMEDKKEYYIYHCTNPEEVALRGDAPIFSEKGPFTYHYEHSLVQRSYSDDPKNARVSFKKKYDHKFRGDENELKKEYRVINFSGMKKWANIRAKPRFKLAIEGFYETFKHSKQNFVRDMFMEELATFYKSTSNGYYLTEGLEDVSDEVRVGVVSDRYYGLSQKYNVYEWTQMCKGKNYRIEHEIYTYFGFSVQSFQQVKTRFCANFGSRYQNSFNDLCRKMYSLDCNDYNISYYQWMYGNLTESYSNKTFKKLFGIYEFALYRKKFMEMLNPVYKEQFIGVQWPGNLHHLLDTKHDHPGIETNKASVLLYKNMQSLYQAGQATVNPFITTVGDGPLDLFRFERIAQILQLSKEQAFMIYSYFEHYVNNTVILQDLGGNLEKERIGHYGAVVLKDISDYCSDFLDVVLYTRALANRHKGYNLSLIHICRCRRYAVCRSRWSPYH
eukprot:TRINITY_DN13308_c0_g1_i2.p1 TRINITY_DN13308_c0_g1~~TRINITY_DN13308_c0_g1_i2.p1  ORF type:complete len:505 (+),score=140.55 TRINITY_DN13308_c0_g1_i2:126-1640(+)